VVKDAHVATPFQWKDRMGVPVFGRKGRMRLVVVRG
jgi:hypothetical protein